MSWICGLIGLFFFFALVIIGAALLVKLFKAVAPAKSGATPTAVVDFPSRVVDFPSRVVAFDPDDPAQQQAVLRRMAAPSADETTADLLKQVAAKKLTPPVVALVLSLILIGATHAGPPSTRPAPSCQGPTCQAAAVQLPEARPVVRQDAVYCGGGSCKAIQAKAVGRLRWVVATYADGSHGMELVDLDTGRSVQR